MLISMNTIRQRLGEQLWQAAINLCGRGGVREETATAQAASYLVTTDPPRRIMLRAAQRPACSCPYFMEHACCVHIAAAAIIAKQSGTLNRLNHTRAVASAPLLLDAMESSIPVESSVRMRVTLFVNTLTGSTLPQLRIGMQVGEARMYVVRSLPEFIRAIDEHIPMEFGKGFSFRPGWMTFGLYEQKIISLLRSLFAAMGDGVTRLKGSELRAVLLPEPFAQSIMEILESIPFRLQINGQATDVEPIRTASMPLRFHVSGRLQGLTIDAWMPKDFVALTDSCSYVLASGQPVHVDARQRHILRVIWQQEMNGHASFDYTMQQAPRVVGELLPFLRLCGIVEIGSEVSKLTEEMPLKAQVYLDRSGHDVIAQARFHYGERVIDPFDETPLPTTLAQGEKLLLRDAAAERQILDTLASAGFHVNKGQIWLTGGDRIYAFVTEGLPRLQQKCEVYASREFERLRPRRPRFSASVHMENGHFRLDVRDGDLPNEQILSIMQELARRKDYFRLKDGTFLDLTMLSDWQPVAGVIADAAAVEGADQIQEKTHLNISACRFAYLSAILSDLALPVNVDDEVKEFVHLLHEPEADETPVPNGLYLRPYQQRGFHWLHMLDRLHMGGILADDMGLGKTVQIISLLKYTKQRDDAEGKHTCSLVVSPTSLTYNWLREISRFAPQLSVMVMSGSGAQRAAQIEHVQHAGDIDVLITSYPLIRRDIDLMQSIPFRFVILDEAQQIKNAGSVGAAAVKKLKAQTRYALTGTPMENSMSELWSIFDFVLPGYLGTYAGFLRRYQDGSAMDDLRRRIRPFLMRRLKSEVLTDLPDKMETVLTAQMTPQQEKVYHASMERLRTRVGHIMEEKGLSRGRAEVLSAMTELRQICCHPSLVLGSYRGSSGKMDLLLDILPGSLKSGHRVLLFSQFTGMLRLLRRQLQESGVTCLYLDGETPSASRMEMVERFNGGWGDVFLISLKAGGMGLNLTGADMVIHYDPWWNPAAEDQATDRAHRIGQKNKVQVIRLVTHNSIEEQVVELGQRKKALFDQLITPGEQLVTALTEADIRALFA